MFFFLYRFVLVNALTLYYSIQVSLAILLYRVLHPFTDPFGRKLRLIPPEILADSKFGVHKYTKVNNIKMHYVESGNSSKPLMIFVHGFPEFWYSWRHQIVEFNKDYWCVAVDMRGYADSEKPEPQSAYAMGELVEDLRDLVRQLGREKFILVAHDWGSVVAYGYRDLYPESLLALIVLAGCPGDIWQHLMWSDTEQFKKSWYVFLFRAWWIPEMWLLFKNMEILEQDLRIEDNQYITEQDIECYKYIYGRPGAFTFPLNYYREAFRYTLEVEPRREDPIPILAAHAQDDHVLSPRILDLLPEKYAGVETVLMKNCGHYAPQQDPKQANALMRQFLEKHGI